MSTIITISVQKFDREGDVIGILPVTIVQDQYRFETDAQADCYFNELNRWVGERPIPDPDISPFPRHINRDPMEIIAILDDMLVPESLYVGQPVEVESQYDRYAMEHPHGNWRVVGQQKEPG